MKLTWLVVGPLDSVPVVGGVQLVGGELESEDLLVDLHVRPRDVHLHLGVALLGSQAVAHNLQNQMSVKLLREESWKFTLFV